MKQMQLSKNELWELVKTGQFQIRPFKILGVVLIYCGIKYPRIKTFKRYINGKILVPDFLIPNREYFDCWKGKRKPENEKLLENDAEIYLSKWPKIFDDDHPIANIGNYNNFYKNPEPFYKY